MSAELAYLSTSAFPAHRDVALVHHILEPLRVQRPDLLEGERVLFSRERGYGRPVRRHLPVVRPDVREVRGRDHDRRLAPQPLRDGVPDLLRDLPLLERERDRDERDPRREVLKERELDLDAMLLAG